MQVRLNESCFSSYDKLPFVFMSVCLISYYNVAHCTHYKSEITACELMYCFARGA